jgi:hypothetical protein
MELKGDEHAPSFGVEFIEYDFESKSKEALFIFGVSSMCSFFIVSLAPCFEARISRNGSSPSCPSRVPICFDKKLAIPCTSKIEQ